eukprot:6189463-Pleurochrysis_carterae.AAC.3
MKSHLSSQKKRHATDLYESCWRLPLGFVTFVFHMRCRCDARIVLVHLQISKGLGPALLNYRQALSLHLPTMLEANIIYEKCTFLRVNLTNKYETQAHQSAKQCQPTRTETMLELNNAGMHKPALPREGLVSPAIVTTCP